jgi:predicted nucleic acid-binding protein
VRVVVDASVAIKWYTPEIRHGEAKDLLDRASVVAAPDLIVAEVTNVAWAKVRRGEIDDETAHHIARAIICGTPALRPAAGLNDRALAIALELAHPVYDCLYLACAEAEGAVLVTDDGRFLRALRGSVWQGQVVPLA